jgi:membrane protease YdiL (CAAX protease family)
VTSDRHLSAPVPGSYARPILAGLAILAVGLVPWTLLAQRNLHLRPELPWAALVAVAYLVVFIAWLHGWGPPSHSQALRRHLLRLWPPRPSADAGLSAGALIGLLAVMYMLWTLISRTAPPPDLSAYPTTAYRWSMFLMGGITAGVVEEVAFRGYMQRGLERHDRDRAIWVTSLVFVASHITQGVGAVIALGPGLFVTSVLYGLLARRTGSILPGMLIHSAGDLARVYFGVLHGDARLLFVN